MNYRHMNNNSLLSNPNLNGSRSSIVYPQKGLLDSELSMNNTLQEEKNQQPKKKEKKNMKVRKVHHQICWILKKLLGCFGCIICCGCWSMCWKRSLRRLELLHHYNIFKALPFVYVIIFLLLDFPFYTKNLIYYVILNKNEDGGKVLSLGFMISDGLIRVFAVPFGLVCYTICNFLIWKYKKTENNTLLGFISFFFLVFTTLAITFRTGFHEVFIKKCLVFEEGDPYKDFDEVLIHLSVYLILPTSPLTSFFLLFFPMLIVTMKNDDQDNQLMYRYVRNVSLLITVWFSKAFEDRIYYKDVQYVSDLRRIQEKVISEKQLCLENLQIIVPLPVLPHFLQQQQQQQQRKSSGIINLKFVYVIQVKIKKKWPRKQNLSEQALHHYYLMYVKCSDLFDEISKKFKMFRIWEEKENMTFLTFSTEKKEKKKILRSFRCVMEMRDMFMKNYSINTVLGICSFFACCGSMCMGLDTTNESKIRFFVSSPNINFKIDLMIKESSKKSSKSTGGCSEVYTMFGNTCEKYSNIKSFTKRKRTGLETIFEEEEEIIKEKKKKKKFKKNKSKKPQKQHEELLKNVKYKEKKEMDAFFSEKRTSLFYSLLFCGGRVFKNKSLEKVYRSWILHRDFDAFNRMVFNVFIGFIIKNMILFGMYFDEGCELFVTGIFGQLPISFLMCIMLSRILFMNGKYCGKCFHVYFFLDSLFSFCWFFYLLRSFRLTHIDMSYIDIDLYYSCFLIFQSHPYIPLFSQAIFSIIKFLIWFSLRMLFIHSESNGNSLYVFFFFLRSIPALLLVFVVIFKRFARIRASRTLFKYSFRVKKTINFLLRNRAVNRAIIINSLPTHLRIKNLLGESENESIKSNSQQEDDISFFGRCNVIMIRFEWVIEEDHDTAEILIEILAYLNESFERIIDNSKLKKIGGSTLERFLFTERCCVIVHYNPSQESLDELFSLSLEINEEIKQLSCIFFEKKIILFSRICIFHDPRASIGCFVGGSHIGYFSEMYSTCLEVMKKRLCSCSSSGGKIINNNNNNNIYRNKVFVLMSVDDLVFRSGYNLKQIFSLGRSSSIILFEVLGRKEKNEEHENNKDVEDNYKKDIVKKPKMKRRYFNLMIDRYLPKEIVNL